MGLSSYHFRELAKAGCIEVVEKVQRRGATEHRYYPVKRVIGDAIDQGTFEGLPDSIMAWDVMRVDMQGYDKGHGIIERAVGELIALGDECADRVKDLPSEQAFLVSYLLSTFESPDRPEKP